MSGDARFLSHHDTLRLMERAAARAGLPLKTSQGFNPRPKLSLPSPRPAGVAGSAELLVMDFAEDVTDPECPGRLGKQFPDGLALREVWPLPPGRPPQVESVTYEMTLGDGEADAARGRLEALAGAERWTVRRATAPDERGGSEKELDVKDRITDIRVEDNRLTFTLVNTPAGSARCGEALALLGLSGPDSAGPRGGAEAIARLTRTEIACRPPMGPSHAKKGIA